MSDVQLNKVTPHRTKDWWIKWIASISLLIAMLLTSNNFILSIYGFKDLV